VERVTSLLDLMDAAYDAPQIHKYSAKLGHMLIIDYNPRSGGKPYMNPVSKARFAEKSATERVSSDLKTIMAAVTCVLKELPKS